MAVESNVFLTTENLAFSLPLLFVCGTYVYFKYLPLHYAALGLVAAFVLYQIRSQMVAQRDKKLTNLDERAIQNLVGEFDKEDEPEKAAAASKKEKAASKVQARLAFERKAEERKASKKKKKGKAADDDDDDDDDLSSFLKKPVKTKSK